MASDESGKLLLQGLVFKMAALIADASEIKNVLARLDEQVADPSARRMHQTMALRDGAQEMWDSTGREMLETMLANQGLDIAAFGVSMDELFMAFTVGFRAAALGEIDVEDDGGGDGDEAERSDEPSGRVRSKPAILNGIGWRRVRRVEEVSLDIPPESADDIAHYVLAYDQQARKIVYIIADSENDFGLSWGFDGEVWTPQNRIPLRLPARRVQGFSGFYDSTRGGVACWTLVASDDGSRALGVLVSGEQVDIIEQTGEIPTGPSDCSFEVGVVFGFDRKRGVTVALGKHAVWEMDGDGCWRHARTVPETLAGDKWFSDNDSAVFEQGTGSVLFFWTDWDDVKYEARAWNGKMFGKFSLRGLPSGAFREHGGVFLPYRDKVAWLGGAGERVHVLSGFRWEPEIDVNPGGPDKSVGAHAAYDPEGDWFVMGPGRYDTPTGDRVKEHVFFVLRGGEWTRHGRPRVGTGSATAERLLWANTAGVYAVHRDWRTLQRVGQGADTARFGEVAPAARARPPVVAVIGDGVERLWAIARGGAVFEWIAGEWLEIGQSSAVFGDWSAPCICHDASHDRLIAWGGEVDGERENRTLWFALDTESSERRTDEWLELEDAGTPVSPRKRRRSRRRSSSHNSSHNDVPEPLPRPSTDVAYALVYDTYLGCVTFFGNDEISVLSGDRWQVEKTPTYFSTIHRQQRLLFHDVQCKETLALDLKDRRVYRCDGQGYTPVANIDEAGNLIELKTSRPERPMQADWVFDPASCELLLYVDDQLDEHHVLALADVIEHANDKGPRSAIRERLEVDDEQANAVVERAAEQLADTLPLAEMNDIIGVGVESVGPDELVQVAQMGWSGPGVDAIEQVCREIGIVTDIGRLRGDGCREAFERAFVVRLERRIKVHLGPF